MRALVLRNILARKMRLAMSALAIVLGVAFLGGVLVFSHGLGKTFDGIINGTTPDALVRVKGAESFSDGISGVSAATVGPQVIARLRALPEVARADGQVNGYGMYVLDEHGKLLGGTGAPTLAFNRTGAPNMDGGQVLRLLHGRWGHGPDEIVLDDGSAKKAGYQVGDTVRLLAPAGDLHRTATLVGTAEFNQGGTAGATLIVFDTAGAQQVFLGGRDAYTTVALTAASGVSQAALTKAADAVLPAGFTAVRGDVIVKESEDALSSSLGVITTFLLVFALVAVVVGAFIIVNTFSILVAQRVRESALLRALGASRRQVTVAVLAEAAAMAIFASTLGIGLGWALARGLAALFSVVGLDISSTFLTLTTSSVVISYAVGIGVTLVAALLPARKAGKVAPVAAMRHEVAEKGSLRRRGVLGAIALTVASAAVVAGLAGFPGMARAAWIGVGGFVALLTVAVTSPVIGQPVLVLCRRVFGRLFGSPGRLAAENAMRDPRRTGATASALMIGLALASMIAVFAASLNKTIDDQVTAAFSPDFIADAAGTFAPFSTNLADDMAQVDGVASVERQQAIQAKIGGDTYTIAADSAGFGATARFKAAAGSVDLGDGKAVVLQSATKDTHWKVGQVLTLSFQAGKKVRIPIGGIVKKNVMAFDVNVPLSVVDQAGITRQDNLVTITMAPGADQAAVKKALDRTVADVPLVGVYDKAGYSDTIRGQVNQLLYMIYGLLALAIIIGVIGIINTLGLSVLERTREIGLLRAIGMTRRQLRGTVTLESVAIAILGAVLGMALGLVFGALLQQVLSDQLTALAMPVGQLAIFAVIAIVVGVLAAVLPAARASRLNVLEAIATE